MFPKIDPRQMNAVMRQLGVKNEQIAAKRVIIETPEKNIIIENPQVMKIEMQGSKSYQVSGDEKSEEKEAFTDDDVEMVVSKTGKTKEEAVEALKASNGDIAEAIMSLQS